MYILNSFEWDSVKAENNFKKHGVLFETAITVFSDHESIDIPDFKHSFNEQRRKRIGKAIENQVLVVIYTIRRIKDEKEKTRVISARKASYKERKIYSSST
ncbi:MAG: BrnT family toxin [Xanthomonadaceae bacterium]|nr:BrnT family toxin [Xanthomonadaceae bacterium]